MISNFFSKIDFENKSFHARTIFGLFSALFCIVLIFIFFVSFVALTGQLFVSNFSPLIKDKIQTPFPYGKNIPYVSSLNEITLPDQFTSRYHHVPIDSTPTLVSKLREFNIWDIGINSSIPPIIFSNYPEELKRRSVRSKKKIFFHTLLPSILVVQAEIKNERNWLDQILHRIGGEPSEIIFNWKSSSWQNHLTQDELLKILWLVKKYRTPKAEILLKRIEIIPASLILAQGAIESSWGSSRFTREGNNLFGIWTWTGQGIVPNRREENMTHKVAAYPSLIDSIRAYCLTINRFSAYTDFRSIRQNSDDSLQLANGLLKYSEKGIIYVNDLKSVIRVNKLKRFDTCYLATM